MRLSGHSPGSDANIRPTPMDHPTYGSVVARLLPKVRGMPPFVLTPTFLFDMGFPTPSAGGGWMGNRYDPLPAVRNRMMARSPAWEGKLPIPDGLGLPAHLTAKSVEGRVRLLGTMDEAFAAARSEAERSTWHSHQAEALDLILSPATQAAFDVSREPATMHERYGRTEMGQVLLLSRRLIEAGVRFVTANAVSNPQNTTLSAFQIWDTHFDHFRLYDQHLMPELDQGLSALISDLDERGLLDETLVIVMGEMGRTPRINANPSAGRDHWGQAYSVLWAGGGIRGGQIVGATDRHAALVKDAPARPDDIAATLYERLGIPHDFVLHDALDRPHRITEGTPIAPADCVSDEIADLRVCRWAAARSRGRLAMAIRDHAGQLGGRAFACSCLALYSAAVSSSMTVLMRRSISSWAVASARRLRLAVRTRSAMFRPTAAERPNAPHSRHDATHSGPILAPQARGCADMQTLNQKIRTDVERDRAVWKFVLIVHVLYALSSRLCRYAAHSALAPRKGWPFIGRMSNPWLFLARQKRSPNRDLAGRARTNREFQRVLAPGLSGGKSCGVSTTPPVAGNATLRCRQAASGHFRAGKASHREGRFNRQRRLLRGASKVR